MPHKPSPSEMDAMLMRLIRGVAVFDGLGRNDMLKLLTMASRSSLEIGDYLFSEGERGDTMYVVINGRLLVSRRRADGQQIRLAEIGPGESIGEIALVDQAPRSATVTALQTSTVLEFPREPVRAYPAVAGALYLNIARTLANRLRHTNEELLAQPLSAPAIDISQD